MSLSFCCKKWKQKINTAHQCSQVFIEEMFSFGVKFQFICHHHDTYPSVVPHDYKIMITRNYNSPTATKQRNTYSNIYKDKWAHTQAMGSKSTLRLMRTLGPSLGSLAQFTWSLLPNALAGQDCIRQGCLVARLVMVFFLEKPNVRSR